MSSSVDQIKSKIDIVSLVSSYIKLEKAGSNFKAKCPFHSEKTPSFFVSPDRGNYYCFGCGAKGDIFTFVQKFEGLDFPGALKILALRAGVPLEKGNYKANGGKEEMFRIMEMATSFFESNLKENNEALSYLDKRGIKKATTKDWRIGFAPKSFDVALNYFKDKGFKEEEIEKV